MQSDEYVIEGPFSDDNNTSLFWSNNNGWVPFDDASRFDYLDTLPIGWVRIWNLTDGIYVEYNNPNTPPPPYLWVWRN